MSPAKLGPAGVLGKHPTRGDFVAFGNRSDHFIDFGDFVTRNIEWAEAKAGREWPNAYAAGGLQAFVYRSSAGGHATALVGAIAPSYDRAGRRYPLTVAMPLFAPPPLLAALGVLPLVLESCWESTSRVLLSLTSNAHGNLDHASSSVPVADLHWDEALASYSHWTSHLPAGELWTLMFGTDPSFDPARALAVVSSTVAACRGVECPESPLALKLPLGHAGGAAVCFWLDLVHRLAQWKRTIPSFFWSHDGQGGTLLLALGQAPPSTLAELWAGAGVKDKICDVARGPWDFGNLQPSDALRACAQQKSQCTVAEVLEAAVEAAH